MDKSERFGMVLSPVEKQALENLAEDERLSAAATIRRLVWREAEQRGLLPPDDQSWSPEKANE